MSDTLPTQDEVAQAVQYMAEQVYGPAFFEKLAAYGIRPSNVGEARQLLELGAMLEEAEAKGVYKMASNEAPATNPFLDHVGYRLKTALAEQPGFAPDLEESAKSVVETDELSKTAALLYAHVLSGGNVAETSAAG